MTPDEKIERAVKIGVHFTKFVEFIITEFEMGGPKELGDLAHLFRITADRMDKEAAEALEREEKS